MLRVTPFSPSVSAKRTGKTAKTVRSPKGFASLLSPAPMEEAPPARAPVQAASSDMILACQSDKQWPSPGREETIAHGSDILNALDALRLALLEKGVSATSLNRLREALDRHLPGSGDTGLDEAVAWANVRAAVELAKREDGRRSEQAESTVRSTP